jgi:hypothetical protein
MARVNPIYRDIELCNFIYRVYRHGLSHTIIPAIKYASTMLLHSAPSPDQRIA